MFTILCNLVVSVVVLCVFVYELTFFKKYNGHEKRLWMMLLSAICLVLGMVYIYFRR